MVELFFCYSTESKRFGEFTFQKTAETRTGNEDFLLGGGGIFEWVLERGGKSGLIAVGIGEGGREREGGGVRRGREGRGRRR